LEEISFQIGRGESMLPDDDRGINGEEIHRGREQRGRGFFLGSLFSKSYSLARAEQYVKK